MSAPIDPYVLLPFTPEPIADMQARFSKAMCQVPNPPTRQFAFDFEMGVRMIASLETLPVEGGTPVYFVHLSFGTSPGQQIIQNDIDLQAVSYTLAPYFVGGRKPCNTAQTTKAFHLFYVEQ